MAASIQPPEDFNLLLLHHARRHIKSNPNASGIRIGHPNSTGDVDLTLSYARDTINEIIPDYVYRFLKSNEFLKVVPEACFFSYIFKRCLEA